MGIDIYARYSGQASKQVAEQAKRWLSATAGDIGYLREAYHGEPYATKFLVREAFENGGEARIPAATLRERLAETLRLAERREIEVYHVSDHREIDDVLDSFRAFVAYCEQAERQTGEAVTIIASY